MFLKSLRFKRKRLLGLALGQRTFVVLALTAIALSIGPISIHAQIVGSPLPPGSDNYTPLKNFIDIKPEESTGAFVYRYPITTPPGRLGVEPNLALEYNSQNQDNSSVFGYGWSINIPSISRRNLHGTDQLYSGLDFSSSLSGDLTPGSSNSDGMVICAARIENGDFLQYKLDTSTNAWTVQDKKGWTYTFGSSATSRQDDPKNATHVYRWFLSSVSDPRGNTMQYTYFKDQGQIYPDTITYTGDSSGAGIYSILFSRTQRSFDKVISFAPGFQVQTNFVVSQIQVQLQGTSVRTYDLNYAVGANQGRSMLASIKETGFNPGSKSTVTLPATTFGYSRNSSMWWQQDSSLTIPVYLSKNVVQVADVNGDGLTDIIVAYDLEGFPPGGTTQNGVVKQVYLNNGHGWTLDPTWTVPIVFRVVINPDFVAQSAVEFIDINGDGKADIIQCSSANARPAVFINNGHGWDENDANTNGTWISAVCMYPSNNGGTGAALGDLNGDGLPDLMSAAQNVIPGTPGQTQITSLISDNIGTDWNGGGLNTSTTPLAFVDPNGFDFGTRLIDVNGDGLADLVQYESFNNQQPIIAAYLNTGSGNWQQSPNFNPTQPFVFFNNTVPPIVKSSPNPVFDINGDGLPDYFPCDINTGSGYVNLNVGSSPPCNSDFGDVPNFENDGFLADVNGDGLLDYIATFCNDPGFCYPDGPFSYVSKVVMNKAVKPDLLTSITNPLGGVTSIAYAPSTQYRKPDGSLANPNLPSAIYTVQKTTATDPVNNISKTTSYFYSGGQYFYDGPFDRKFGGFSQVAATDSAGNQIVTTFLQADPSQNPPAGTANAYNHTESLIGKAAKIEVFDSSGNLFTRTVNTWSIVNLGSFQDFPELTQTLVMSFDGTSKHKDKAEGYFYDVTTGNLTQKTEFGEVLGKDDGTFTDTGNDEFTTTYSYATDGKTIVGLPDDITVTDQSGNKIKETKYFYDGKPFGSVSIGDVTEEDHWESGSSFAKILKSYTGDGLLKTVTDPRGNVTTYAPDSFNLYPATITNALKQATKYAYDYAAGKVAQKTDPNNFAFQYAYDGLGRITQESQPDLKNPNKSVVKSSYSYVDSQGGESSQRSDFLDANNSSDTFRYYDGLGRLIQERKSAEDSGKFNVKDFAYDNRGLLIQESLPYVSDGSAKTSPATTTALLISYSYDALGRVTNITNAVGTTKNTFSPWQVTVTDANNHSKDLFKDAYDNLAQVNEHNGSKTYTTTYSYDGLKDLTKITDANGNVRNFSYDGLGRRVSAEDLHTPSASSFGIWTFNYDDGINLTKKVDPNNNIINYSYDALNRLTQEDLGFLDRTIQAQYTYDTCSNGIGRLCSVTNASVTTNNSYNALSLLSAEIKTINGTDYETDYQYDPQGHQTLITNPDGSQIQYTYNLAGLVETVFHKEASDSAFSPVVLNFDYSPLGKVATGSLANGAVTTNTYDANKLYRLTHKVTTLPTSGSGTVKIQDISYGYDAVGNITGITDNSSTNANKSVAYDYDDLNRLTSYKVTGAANGDNHSETYSYDPVGNITNKSDMGDYNYAGTGFPNPDAITALGSTTYSYDNNGNLKTVGSVITNSWDYNNRLLKSTFNTEPPPALDKRR